MLILPYIRINIIIYSPVYLRTISQLPGLTSELGRMLKGAIGRRLKIPHYFELKTSSNLRRASLLRREVQGKKFASKYISLSVKFTAVLARSLVLRVK